VAVEGHGVGVGGTGGAGMAELIRREVFYITKYKKHSYVINVNYEIARRICSGNALTLLILELIDAFLIEKKRKLLILEVDAFLIEILFKKNEVAYEREKTFKK
jgi:hypothetical protein